MTKELDDKLCEKYPRIFVDRHGDPKETCMCWGFPGNGWYWLLDKLCQHLQWNIDRNGDPQLKAVQVKEKFGSLRVYTEGGNAEQHAVIHFAEALSYGICETCGTTKGVEQRRKNGWVYTSCEECKKDDTV